MRLFDNNTKKPDAYEPNSFNGPKENRQYAEPALPIVLTIVTVMTRSRGSGCFTTSQSRRSLIQCAVEFAVGGGQGVG
jgi:hypothetical protein